MPNNPEQNPGMTTIHQMGLSGMTREDWLRRAIAKLRPLFAAKGIELPAVIAASCGWPLHHALGSKKRRHGECWRRSSSPADVNNIFITPLISDSVEVLAVLMHELIHVSDDCASGHRGAFRDRAWALGFENKLTDSQPGSALKTKLEAIARQLGPYPHSAISAAGPQTRQTTRLLKAYCPSCGYVIRTTRFWAVTGLPVCNCGVRMVCPDVESQA